MQIMIFRQTRDNAAGLSVSVSHFSTMTGKILVRTLDFISGFVKEILSRVVLSKSS